MSDSQQFSVSFCLSQTEKDILFFFSRKIKNSTSIKIKNTMMPFLMLLDKSIKGTIYRESIIGTGVLLKFKKNLNHFGMEMWGRAIELG